MTSPQGERVAAAAVTRTGCFATKPDDPIGWCSGHNCFVDRCPAEPIMILSLLQPWATLWVTGAKRVETRSWGTSYRGRVVVHASKAFKQEEMRLCREEPFNSALSDLGVKKFRDIPTGAVLGWVNVIECLPMAERTTARGVAFELGGEHRHELLTEDEQAFGNYQPGRFAWITGQTRAVLAKPIPLKGALGLRHCPADVAERLAS